MKLLFGRSSRLNGVSCIRLLRYSFHIRVQVGLPEFTRINYLRSLWQAAVEKDHLRTFLPWGLTPYLITGNTVPIMEIFKLYSHEVLFNVYWSFTGNQHFTFWREIQCPFARLTRGWSYKKELLNHYQLIFLSEMFQHFISYPVFQTVLGCSDCPLPHKGTVWVFCEVLDVGPFWPSEV